MMIALEEAVMEIIVNAGQSRSLCFEALHAARQGNIDEAKAAARSRRLRAPGAQDADQTDRAGCGRRPPADDVNHGARAGSFNELLISA